jgi:hypothetical protein
MLHLHVRLVVRCTTVALGAPVTHGRLMIRSPAGTQHVPCSHPAHVKCEQGYAFSWSQINSAALDDSPHTVLEGITHP